MGRGLADDDKHTWVMLDSGVQRTFATPCLHTWYGSRTQLSGSGKMLCSEAQASRWLLLWLLSCLNHLSLCVGWAASFWSWNSFPALKGSYLNPHKYNQQCVVIVRILLLHPISVCALGMLHVSRVQQVHLLEMWCAAFSLGNSYYINSVVTSKLCVILIPG